MVTEAPKGEGRGLPEPEWRRLSSCDFCGAPLTPLEQLAGACRSCREKLAEERKTVPKNEPESVPKTRTARGPHKGRRRPGAEGQGILVEPIAGERCPTWGRRPGVEKHEPNRRR
jgi:hypothetical protein